jgi:hypothetical protein
MNATRTNKTPKICATGQYILTILTTVYGLGLHIYVVPKSDIALFFEAFTIQGLFYIWCITLVKISLCILLLRVQSNRTWKIGIWVLLVFIALLGIAGTLWGVLQCRPIEAIWDYSYPRSDCISNTLFRNWIYTSSS